MKTGRPALHGMFPTEELAIAARDDYERSNGR